MKYLTQAQCQHLFDKGVILENRHNQTYVTTFKLFGNTYITNKRRLRKRRLSSSSSYRFDDPYWVVAKGSILYRIYLVLTKVAIKLHK